MTAYTESQMTELLSKLESPADIGILIVLYGAEVLKAKPLTDGQVDKIIGFPREGTAKGYLTRLEKAGLAEANEYLDIGTTEEEDRWIRGYRAAPAFREFILKVGLDKVIREKLGTP
jgi:hypothetical protein